MAAVSESARIALDADHLWEQVGRFGELVWHPLLVRVESIGNQPGAMRHMETTDGQRQVERLDEIDEEQHLYRYTIQDSSLAITNCRAELRIDSLSPQSSWVTWSARFDVAADDEASESDSVRHFLRTGLNGLRARYGS